MLHNGGVEMDDSDLGNRIRMLREEDKISQEDLADGLQIGRITLSYYETGTRPVPIKILLRLADYFYVSTDYLLGLSGYHKGTGELSHQYKDFSDALFAISGMSQIKRQLINELIFSKRFEEFAQELEKYYKIENTISIAQEKDADLINYLKKNTLVCPTSEKHNDYNESKKITIFNASRTLDSMFKTASKIVSAFEKHKAITKVLFDKENEFMTPYFIRDNEMSKKEVSEMLDKMKKDPAISTLKSNLRQIENFLYEHRPYGWDQSKYSQNQIKKYELVLKRYQTHNKQFDDTAFSDPGMQIIHNALNDRFKEQREEQKRRKNISKKYT